MFNFASLTLTELAPILGILAGMLVGFYGLLKFVLNNAEKSQENDRAERQELSKAIGKMADNMLEVASASREVAISNARIADESKERNGHLAEITVQSRDQVIDQIKGLVIEQQTVHNQTVEHEKVISKE